MRIYFTECNHQHILSVEADDETLGWLTLNRNGDYIFECKPHLVALTKTELKVIYEKLEELEKLNETPNPLGK